MHWLEHTFALPALPKGKKWYRIASTAEGVMEKAVLLEDQKFAEIKERTIVIFAGR